MDYNVQNISFSVPDNDREENFGLKEWAGNKMLDAMLAAAKNRIGNLNLGDVAGKVVSGDLTPLQDLYDKFMGGNKTESTTPENNTGASSNSLWTGIVDFIKNHPYLSAGGAALAGHFLSNAMRQPRYGMQMPSYGMGYGMGYGMPMSMPMYQPMMMPNYGYYGNGLSSAITSLAPILAAYGINKFANSQSKPTSTTAPLPTTQSNQSKDPNEGAQNPDEYARELMEQFPDHVEDIQKNLESFEKKYNGNWNKINTGLKGLAITYGNSSNTQPNQTQQEENDEWDGPLDKVKRGLTKIEGFHPITWLQRHGAEKKLRKIEASHSEDYLQQLQKQILEKEAKTGKSIPEIIDEVYKKKGDHRVKQAITNGTKNAINASKGIAQKTWGSIKNGAKKGWGAAKDVAKDVGDWVKDKYRAWDKSQSQPNQTLYSAKINLQEWKDKLYKIQEV